MSAAALERLRALRPDDVIATHAQHGDETAIVKPERVLDCARTLKEDPELAFDQLIDLTCIDTLGLDGRTLKVISGTPVAGGSSNMAVTGRFQVVYHFRSTKTGKRIRLKAALVDDSEGDESVLPVIDSLTPLYKSANWAEREAFDMFGVRFKGHPDLRRILMYEEFIGYPLRKDYPKEKRQPLVRRDWT